MRKKNIIPLLMLVSMTVSACQMKTTKDTDIENPLPSIEATASNVHTYKTHADAPEFAAQIMIELPDKSVDITEYMRLCDSYHCNVDSNIITEYMGYKEIPIESEDAEFPKGINDKETQVIWKEYEHENGNRIQIAVNGKEIIFNGNVGYNYQIIEMVNDDVYSFDILTLLQAAGYDEIEVRRNENILSYHVTGEDKENG